MPHSFMPTDTVIARADRRHLLLGVLFLLGVITLWIGGAKVFGGADLSEVQLVAFPLVAIILLRIRIVDTRISFFVWVLGVVSATLAVSYSYLYLRDAPLSFVVAHLADDEFEAESRQFREEINRQLQLMHAPRALIAQRSHETLHSHAEAERFLNRSEHLPLVVWGKPQWINISLHAERTRSLAPEALKPWLARARLQTVNSTPILGLSRVPQAATAEFIASTFSALLFLAKEPDLELQRWIERSMLKAATQQAPWTSFAHRAYAWWVLGNLALMDALEGAGYESGELHCALGYYTRARQALKANDNPELLAATLNNRAVAYFIAAIAEHRKEYRAQARKNFKAAAQTLRERNLFGVKFSAGKIARRNIKNLRRYGLLRAGAGKHMAGARKHKKAKLRIKNVQKKKVRRGLNDF